MSFSLPAASSAAAELSLLRRRIVAFMVRLNAPRARLDARPGRRRKPQPRLRAAYIEQAAMAREMDRL
ncbi:hypothetical protein ACP6C7_01615 [Mycolicibacterium septicum]|uniref:Uncharacterized protein n=2 Tax=Mycolicibacterium septicum TaxID=98668 RepID=A0ABW9LR58_9MYCO